MNDSVSASPRRRIAWVLGLLIVAGLGVYAWISWQTEATLRESAERGAVTDRIGRNAPYITTPDQIVDKMVDMAELSSDDLAYDLGCGDGRIIIAAALKTGCRGVGVDIDPERVAEARENVRKAGVEHLVEIREGDVFKVDLQEADAVLMYLLPWMTKKLVPQLREMKEGSRIVSHDFGLGDIKDIEPERTEILADDTGNEHRIHRWVAPLPQ